MKKLLLVILLVSFRADTPKTLKVELSIDEWNSVLQVIDQSNAPHQQVKKVQSIIVSQLQKQVSDTTQKKK